MRATKKLDWIYLERLLTVLCTVVAAVWILSALGLLLYLYVGLSISEMSSWAQTVGTVAAVFAAIWTVRRQERRENLRSKSSEIITAKALVEMSRSAHFAVMRLNKVIAPGARFPHEISEVKDVLRNFDKIDLLALPDARMLDQISIVRANLRLVISSAELAETLLLESAAMEKIGLMKTSELILHGALFNLRIVYAQLGGDHALPPLR